MHGTANCINPWYAISCVTNTGSSVLHISENEYHIQGSWKIVITNKELSQLSLPVLVILLSVSTGNKLMKKKLKLEFDLLGLHRIHILLYTVHVVHTQNKVLQFTDACILRCGLITKITWNSRMSCIATEKKSHITQHVKPPLSGSACATKSTPLGSSVELCPSLASHLPRHARYARPTPLPWLFCISSLSLLRPTPYLCRRAWLVPRPRHTLRRSIVHSKHI